MAFMDWNYHRNMTREERSIYALIFNGKRCYIGKTINPERRRKEHMRTCSGWGEEFRFQVVDSVYGSMWDANRLEFAYRWAAYNAGWRVYSGPCEFYSDLAVTVYPEVKEIGAEIDWMSAQGRVD